MKPTRIQLKRAAGWRMPENTVKVDRTTKWGNPFVVGRAGGGFTAKVVSPRHAVQLFRSIAIDNLELIEKARAELRGMNLACWCKIGDSCHADVLLEIANS